jgi:hypothetical protein
MIKTATEMTKQERVHLFRDFVKTNAAHCKLVDAEKSAKFEFESAKIAIQTKHGVMTSEDAINEAKWHSTRADFQSCSDAVDASVDAFLESL